MNMAFQTGQPTAVGASTLAAILAGRCMPVPISLTRKTPSGRRVARARSIKPGFFSNDDLAKLAPLTRLLFAGLWTLADREGRLEDRPARIKAQVLPYDACDVNQMLDDLAESSAFLLRYRVANVSYIQILNFKKHQNPHAKEAASTLPEPEIPELAPAIPERAGLVLDSLNLTPDSLNPEPLTLNPEPGTVEQNFSTSPQGSTLSRGRAKTKKHASPNGAANSLGTRLPKDWQLPKDWGEWALTERPDFTEQKVRTVAEIFADHWHAKPGSGGRKLDWQATWRNWVRTQWDKKTGVSDARQSERQRVIDELTGSGNKGRTFDHEKDH